jgi:hypothetical protein
LWLIEADVFQMPQLHKHFNVVRYKMKQLFITIFFLLSVQLCCGQSLSINNGVDTSDSKVAAAISFYRQYLSEMKYNELPDFKKYWQTKDLQQNKYPDPLLFALTDFPTYLMGESKTLIYAKPLNDYVQLKTLFASADSLKNIAVTCITNHFIGFDSSGKPYFISPVDTHTKNWKQVRRRNITFIFPSSHIFNLIRADSLLSKVQNLEKDWALEPISIRYYLSNTNDELQQLKGFDFVVGMGNKEIPSGKADDKGNIIYAAGLGENYFHEVVHIYLNRRYPHSPLREGLATFYGGSRGNNLSWHLTRLNKYLQAHPNVDLNKFIDFHYMDNLTNPNATIEGLLCLLAFKKDGLTGLKRIMGYTSLEDVFSKEFQVQKGQWNVFIREILQKRQFTAYNNGISAIAADEQMLSK